MESLKPREQDKAWMEELKGQVEYLSKQSAEQLAQFDSLNAHILKHYPQLDNHMIKLVG
jgi:hypothetical protein